MIWAIWICIGIDCLGAIALLIMTQSSGQDAAGQGMLLLPILLLFIAAAIAWYLLKSNHTQWALVVSGVPALIIVIIAAFTLKDL